MIRSTARMNTTVGLGGHRTTTTRVCVGGRAGFRAHRSQIRQYKNITESPLVEQRGTRAVKKSTVVCAASTENQQQQFIPVMKPEDLPKGVRKEVRVEGKSVLLFWYRNQIYAIESRSPAEGAYSEGFIRAKFTQDYGIECPTTGTLFSLKDGSIMSWYPNNPVLRMLTPSSTCRNMEIYPVKLEQDAISVDVSGSVLTNAGVGYNSTKGGSDTSLENNNVYGLEPRMYVEGSGEAEEPTISKVATIGVGVFAVGAVLAVAVALIQYIQQ